MRRKPGLVAVIALGGLAFACSKSEAPQPAAPPPPAPTPAAAPAPTPPPTPTAATTPREQPKPHQMENCPSAVEGAVTKVTNTKDGVELLVTAKDPKAEKEIRARAHKQAELKAPANATTHTQNGAHGGDVGSCPILHGNTEIAVKDVKGGAKITLKAKKKDDVAALQKSAKERADAIAKSSATPTKGAKTPAAPHKT